jgi:hypothetical protein
LKLLPRADLYLQDEVQFAFHPTLTRVWSVKGRRGQRLVEAPGDNRHPSMALGCSTGETAGLTGGLPPDGRLMFFASRCVPQWLVRPHGGVWPSSLRTTSRPTRRRGLCLCASRADRTFRSTVSGLHPCL